MWLAALPTLIAMALIISQLSLLRNGRAISDPVAADAVARSVGQSFIKRYVDDEGRVVREDEGGDVVSEGQSYGMLVAVAIGDENTFRKVWSWTKSNLTRPDGLLAWRWYDGSIKDSNSASDADVDAARALALAGVRFRDPEFTAESKRIAAAVLMLEVVPFAPDSPDGATSADHRQGAVLVAGDWAVSVPREVNPSYFNPRGERDLLALTSDQRWSAMSSTHRWILDRLMLDAALPPDWFRLDGNSMTPTGHDQAPVQFGLDAARIPIRLAESCALEDRRLAARMRATLDSPSSPPGIRDLDGHPAVEWKHSVALVAAAAADHAAGDAVATREKLSAAAELDGRYPSYYGAAWVALGYIMLQTSMLGSCDN